MSFFSRAVNTFKSNGLSGSVKVYKNFLRIKAFNKKYGDNNLPTDDVFSDYNPFDCEYQNDRAFDEFKSSVKPLAFFLPQFHAIPENNEWWGEGFTEWTNTKKCEPRFENHYQPRTPHSNIGYYNLDDVNVLKRQAEFAKRHGIYGFCFYHYWFSGKRLLEKPVDMLLAHPEIDINFLLCWANENWTKAWDGQQQSILIKQNYTKSDPEQFIDDLKKYIDDERYIKVNGKPVILIYNCAEIPNVKKVLLKMRKRALENGTGEILIWSCRTHSTTADTLKITDYIDAEVEFPPHNTAFDFLKVNEISTAQRSNIYNYQKLAKFVTNSYNKDSKKPIYRTVMTAWDNSCRRKDNYTVYYGFSIKSFYDWVKAAVQDAIAKLKEEERFIFVNAFNEWAEGTYLEPDEKYGYANINAFSCALFDLPLLKPAVSIKTAAPDTVNAPKIAVQAHITSINSLSFVIDKIKDFPFDFDLFISTDTPQKQQFIKNSFAQKCGDISLKIDVFESATGLLPAVLQMKDKYKNYELLCHIQTPKADNKKRDYLFSLSLGSPEQIAGIVNEFNQNLKLGLLFPEISENEMFWNNKRATTEQMLLKLNISPATDEKIVFPADHTFWARTDAIKQIFTDEYDASTFCEVLAHSIKFISSYNGYDFLQIKEKS